MYNKGVRKLMNLKEISQKGGLDTLSKEELSKVAMDSKEIVYEYNSCKPKEAQKKHDILKKLIGKLGENVTIRIPFICDYGFNITIGDEAFINYNCCILDHSEVVIGKHVRIAPNVSIFSTTHSVNPKIRLKSSCYGKKIVIEDNVWIGGGSIINPGVTIGENSVIGSGSVVTKSIPANVVAVGNPCKVIRDISEDEI